MKEILLESFSMFYVDCFQIDFYNAQFQTLQDVDSSVVFENWLRVDVKPFRHSALQAAKKWASMFKNHLLRHVQTRCEGKENNISRGTEIVFFSQIEIF